MADLSKLNLRRRFSLSARLTGSAAGGARSALECSMASRFELNSNPQFFSNLLLEPPIRPRRDDLVRRRLDHAELALTQRPETDRVLGVVVAPGAIGDVV